jgi:hypothetical protein
MFLATSVHSALLFLQPAPTKIYVTTERQVTDYDKGSRNRATTTEKLQQTEMT